MFDKRFVLILVIEFCFQMGSFVINPIVSSYVVAIGGIVMLGGLLAGINSVSALAARPLVGASVDRFDLPKLLLVAGVLSCSSSFFCAIIRDVFVVAACRVVFGVAFAFKSTVIVALARLALPENRVGAGLGYVSLLYVLANALGPLLGTELGIRFGYQVCFFLSASLFAIAIFLVLGLIRKKDAPFRSKEGKGFLADKRNEIDGHSLSRVIYRPAIKPTIMAGMVAFTLGSTNTLLVLAMSERNIGGVSAFFFVSALVMLISRPLAGKLCDKRGFLFVFFPASVAALLSMICLASSQSLWMLVLAAVFLASGQCTLTVLIQSEGMRHVPKEYVGRASNTLFLGPDIGMFLGPAIGGIVLQTAGSSALFFANADIILSMVLFFSLVKGVSLTSSR